MLVEIKVIVSEEETEAMQMVKELIDGSWRWYTRKDDSETVFRSCKFMLADDKEDNEYIKEELKKRLIW